MLFSTFAWSFTFISLPFHVRELSDLDAAATLRWTGWIVGITNLVTVVTAPVWGRLGRRYDPKTLYIAVEALQGASFLALAAARSLGELFVIRFVLGGWGAASTFAFIIAGRSPDPADVRRRVAHVQSALTVGQVFGPLVGAVTAVQLGFRGSFLVGGAILFGCAWLVHRGATVPPPTTATTARTAHTNWRDVAHVTAIVLGGSIQVMFLPAILPEILPTLGVSADRTIQVAGMLIFVSGVAAALGALLATRLPDVFPDARLIPALLALSSGFLVAFGFAGSVWMLGALRFFQVLCVAPVFPMVIARIAHRAGGEAIGFINSGRIAAAFIGPVAATMLLAWAPAPVLYAALGVVGFACVPLAWRGELARWTPA